MPLSDEESIDRVNPFVQHDFFMPGTSRQIVDFQKHTKKVQEQPEEMYRSPMCDYGVMVAGRIGNTGTCPLSRSLYPGRNIQYDEGVRLYTEKYSPEVVVKKTNSNAFNNVVGATILLLLIAAL